MKKQISPKIVSLVFAVMVICFVIAFYALAVWHEPTQPQPGGNVPPPLNVSDSSQIKQGPLSLNILGASPTGLFVNQDAFFVQGEVGIGTTSPSQKLDVVGNIVASGTICDSGGANCIGRGLNTVNNQVFSGSNPPTHAYQGLNLSHVVGANPALVYLKVKNNSPAGFDVFFRTNGTTESVYGRNGATAAAVGPGTIAYLLVQTDSNGWVAWRVNASLSITVTVVSYIK